MNENEKGKSLSTKMTKEKVKLKAKYNKNTIVHKMTENKLTIENDCYLKIVTNIFYYIIILVIYIIVK